MSAIIPPVDEIRITIDNKTGQVQCLMSRPLPFPLIAMLLGKVIGQLGEQAAAPAAAAAPLMQANGKGVHP